MYDVYFQPDDINRRNYRCFIVIDSKRKIARSLNVNICIDEEVKGKNRTIPLGAGLDKRHCVTLQLSIIFSLYSNT